MKSAVAALAAQGVHIGTSSWKYPGWFGRLYERDRYVWRGKFSNARFERNCLAEYAQVFKTVSLDAAFYQFPTREWLEPMVEQVPSDFQFGLKVTDAITLKTFPNLPRFGKRAGQGNEHFLNADLFASAFLSPCEPFKSNIGLVMFEFTRFRTADLERGRDFAAALDVFLEKLPHDWPYAVEIRNRSFLAPEYFSILSRHGVAHVFNSWTDMPPVNEQLSQPGSVSNPDLVAARFLLKPGRKYEDAVKRFSPYDRLQEEYAEGRAAATELVRRGRARAGRSRSYIFVNNRFEGSALDTIAAVLDAGGEMGNEERNDK
ncbi:MAG TPA: DUF72 domain-containing protein [Verrucomicrobiota bacterium]|nr:DUF72 domain-containing protein [Verrucomicrobiota bacterium]